jgi:hypothetical protein
MVPPTSADVQRRGGHRGALAVTETWIRTELKIAHSVTVCGIDGQARQIKIVRTSDPRPGRSWGLPLFRLIWFWYTRLVRLLKRDRRWSVEMLLGEHRAWIDWHRAEVVDVVDGRDGAFERAVEVAKEIESGR